MVWKEIFQRDWILKAISLAFAILLWFFVIGEEKAEVSISLPIEIVNLPGDYVVANDIPSSIDLRVYGPRGLIQAMTTQNLTRVIDLRNAKAGTVTVHISPESIPALGGVKVTRIQPSSIDILLEPFLRRNIPVRPRITGQVAKDFEIREIRAEPDTVMVSGPEDIITKMAEISTIPVDVTGATATVSGEFGFDLKGSRISVDNNEAVARVTVVITPVIGSRKITHVPVQADPDRKGVSVWPKTVSVVVEGPRISLGSIAPEDIAVRVPLDALQPGSHEVAPDVVVPSGFVAKEIVPAQLRVRISK